MAPALCVVNNYDYNHRLIICSIYCLSTLKMVTRTPLNVTFIRTLPVLYAQHTVSMDQLV